MIVGAKGLFIFRKIAICLTLAVNSFALASPWVTAPLAQGPLVAFNETNPTSEPKEMPRSHKASDFVEIDLFTGPTGLTGQFTDQKNPNSWGFSANIYFQSRQEVRHPGYLSVSNFTFSAVSKDELFPFPVGQAVEFSSSTLSLLVPVYDYDQLSLYLGIGYSLISALNDHDKKYVQNYGSDQFQFQIRYDLSERWCLNYRTVWQQINQYQNGTFSFIEMWSHFVGLGYMIF
jgi:hypothetical protein